MLPIYICDDNLTFLKMLAELIKNKIIIENYDMHIVFCTDDPYELLLRIQDEKNTGIYFLDITLKSDINGLTLAQKIRKIDPRGYIVFVTTHAEMMLLTFEYKVEALDYIIKDTGNLPEKVATCLSHINEHHSTQTTKNTTFSVPIGDKLFVEDYDNIFLFEVSATIHKVIMVAKKRQVEFYSSLSNIQDCLDGRFIRCSNSLIVNTDKIVEFDKKKRLIVLSNGDSCTVSARNMKSVLLKIKKTP